VTDHEVTVESQIVTWDGTEVFISCSCGEVIMYDDRKRSFLEVEKAVHDHLLKGASCPTRES